MVICSCPIYGAKFFVGQPFRVALRKAKALPYNLDKSSNYVCI